MRITRRASSLSIAFGDRAAFALFDLDRHPPAALFAAADRSASASAASAWVGEAIGQSTVLPVKR